MEVLLNLKIKNKNSNKVLDDFQKVCQKVKLKGSGINSVAF